MDLQWLVSDGSDADELPILLAILGEGGEIGVGEIVGSSARSAASVGQLMRAIAGRLAGLDFRNINVALDAAAEIARGDAERGPAVRAALDSALHDLNGRMRGCPVHAMLGGSYRTTIALSRQISGGDSADRGDNGRGAEEKTPEAVRVPYKPEPPRHPASYGADTARGRIAAAIDRFGSAVQVDIEAAGAFAGTAEAKVFVEALLQDQHRINLGLIDPLGEHDLVGHAALCRALPIPVILQASVRSAEAMGQIVRLGAADRIILNIDRVGGLRAAMRVVAIAEAASVGVAAASEARTAVGAAAAFHLAAALHDTFPVLLDGFAPSSAVSDAGFTVGDHAVSLGDSPGLGVTLAPSARAAFRPLD